MTSREELDRGLRRHVYDVTMRRGSPPLIAEAAERLGADEREIRGSLERLAAGRILVLQRDRGEILMANPFSAVPTPFLVQTDSYSCYGNCIWDALGIPAMLHGNATLTTACGCCGFAMQLQVAGENLREHDGIVHFAVSAIRWWDDIVFT